MNDVLKTINNRVSLRGYEKKEIAKEIAEIVSEEITEEFK